MFSSSPPLVTRWKKGKGYIRSDLEKGGFQNSSKFKLKVCFS